MIFFGILFSFFYFLLDITEKKIFALPTSLFVIFYSLSFDLIQWDKMAEICFVYEIPEFDLRSYLLYFITLCSFLYAIAFLRYYQKTSVQIRNEYSIAKLKELYYFFALLSIGGFCVNISRIIGNFQLLFIAPREYEAIFGSNVIINYLYFLNVPALCLFVYISHFGGKVKYGIFINILLVAVSFFHGIKFTIFDTIMYPICLYYILQKRQSFKLLIISAIFLLLIFIAFSELVRGANDKSPFLSIMSYIIPNFYNLSYTLEHSPMSCGDIYSLFLPDKIPSPTKILRMGESFNGQFILNPSYNMYTSLELLFKVFNLLGPLFYIVIFGIQYICYCKKERSIIYSFLSAYFLFCLFFAFYFYAYTKFKNMYYVFIFILIDYYARTTLKINKEK